ncbi:fibrobacter succinogenes major paralogous domain-containing protein [Flavobacterium paronense]|uniref:Fibrobacter succinogenes major paralogous domain-containing protein n=1 Tax=Flavobacterium paronense TaxID=1392775 RepID=A0ABV5GHI0_9FLAO|nr:fibrobacter succinogenes major paralogous domain-containing protein [Flavobacterium paronense]MDN3676442.1 fibrobacter succinogenes major paralogous domain-containing protein [Flavobacterium paronense]
MKRYFLIFTFFIVSIASAQVGIGTTTPDASSILDVKSTAAGFLPPRMTTAQRNAIVSPAIGLTIYNTSINCVEWWNGSLWYNACGTTFLASIPSNPLCVGKTISKTPCSMVAGATVNDDSTTPLGVEYDWSNATNSTMGIGLGATTNTRALVEIGGQCWCRYNADIANTNLTAFTNTPTSAWSGYYNNASSELAANEGKLYQWTAAMQGAILERSQGVCPAGFHIPSDCEWMYLESVLGMSVADMQGSFFRNTGSVGSDLSSLTSSGTNASGLTALLTGYKDNTGSFNFVSRASGGYWWSSTESSATTVVHRGIDNSNTGSSRNPNVAKAQAFCLRCIKD